MPDFREPRWKRCLRWWLEPSGLHDFALWEMLIMRWLFSALIFVNLPGEPPGFASQEHPHGFARLGLDFTFIANPDIFWPLRTAVVVALAGYACGASAIPTLGIYLFFQTCVSTLNQSQGFTGHAGQLVALLCLAQFAAGVWSLFSRPGGWKNGLWQTTDGMRRGVNWSCQTIAAAYFVAGVSKLMISGLGWLQRSSYFVLQVHKAQGDLYYANGTEPDRWHRWFTSVLAGHPWVSSLTLVAGLAMELGAFALLLNRKMAALFGLAFICFHLLLSMFMGVAFLSNQRALAIFLVNLPYWALVLIKRLMGLRRQDLPSTSNHE